MGRRGESQTKMLFDSRNGHEEVMSLCQSTEKHRSSRKLISAKAAKLALAAIGFAVRLGAKPGMSSDRHHGGVSRDIPSHRRRRAQDVCVRQRVSEASPRGDNSPGRSEPGCRPGRHKTY